MVIVGGGFAGMNLAVADMKKHTVSGFLGWVLWMAVHRWFLIGFRNKAVVLVNWVWSYLTDDRGRRVLQRNSTGTNSRTSSPA